ncbi:ImmA/IrrE family metallo-endopeptidase [Aliivibrio salmonicida]|uniref:ImmA/IrrE family metallo-endopeptidase n=1 Tax=Aliivibrio salmonicida TaxID=40269 RepID=UPI00406CA2D5
MRDLLVNSRFSNTQLPIAELLDYLRDSGQIEFEVLEDNKLPNEYAVSSPNEKIIRCRESVYERALNGSARDKFTLAHELGHVLMHQNTNPEFARSQSDSNHHYTEDAEWQANTFSSEFLVDSRQLEGINSPRDIEKRFGISFESAGYVYDRYSKEGLL